MSTLTLTLAAERYAAANASDPFALARAQAHLRNGVASYALPDGKPGYYDAEEHQERREMVVNGKVISWSATIYRNVARP